MRAKKYSDEFKWDALSMVKEDQRSVAEIKRLKRELEIMRQEHDIVKSCTCGA